MEPALHGLTIWRHSIITHGLVSEYFRLPELSERIGSYTTSAAKAWRCYTCCVCFQVALGGKLVHLLFGRNSQAICRSEELGIWQREIVDGAALYVYAPVVGISGTCAYGCALVCSTLATFVPRGRTDERDASSGRTTGRIFARDQD